MGCRSWQELVPSNSFKQSLVSGTTSTPGRGFSLYLKHQASTTRHAGALACCKVELPHVISAHLERLQVGRNANGIQRHHSRATTLSQCKPYLFSFQHPRAFVVSRRPVISAKDLQQFCGFVRVMVHQDFTVPLHVTLCLIKRQFSNVAQSLLVVLWRQPAK